VMMEAASMRLKRELSERADKAHDPDRFFYCSSDESGDDERQARGRGSSMSSRRVSRSATPSRRSRSTSRGRTPNRVRSPGAAIPFHPDDPDQSPAYTQPAPSAFPATLAHSRSPDSDEDDSPSLLNHTSDKASISSYHIANHIDDYLTQPRCAAAAGHGHDKGGHLGRM
jgi:hypothetical protein